MVLSAVSVALADNPGMGDQAQESFAYWTAGRVATATPRDLVIDDRGLAYLRSADGGLNPYGHAVVAKLPLRSTPFAGASLAPRAEDSGYVAAPTIAAMSPDNETIGASHTFTAQVTSDSGIKQITAYVAPDSSASYQRFQMSYVGSEGDTQTWQLNLTGFSDGNWKWYVDVKDNAPRGGNRLTSPIVSFSVDTSGSGGGGDGTVTNARWTDGGAVQTAAGRIIFSMPDGDYVCSGTAVTDSTTGRSIVLTAAHCVYDDIAKVFSSNAIFIPSQDDGGSDRTDFDCSNDPIGCWSLDHGVVDLNWTTRTFPDNIAWDYGFYVVSDTGAHSGAGGSDALDVAAGTLTIDFSTPTTGATATALGYSYSYDPNFMYCQETMATNGSANYWLDSCDLSGGASGGPWLQPLDAGNGSIISVNSWGYTTRSGMAGPKLHGTSASTLFDVASFTDLASTSRGVVVDANNPPTSSTTTTTTSTLPDPGGITLDVDNYKLRGEKNANLTWTGADGTTVDILRDGVVVATTDNDDYYVDSTGLKGGGLNSWQVCETDALTSCSAVVAVSW